MEGQDAPSFQFRVTSARLQKTESSRSQEEEEDDDDRGGG